jgi:acetyl-CoA acetyltransferase
MVHHSLDAAIAGIGATEFSKASGRSELQLAAECSLAACRDAGVDPRDVDGMITFTLDNSDELGLARCLGARNITYTTRIPGGGAGSTATIGQAMAAISAGLCNHLIIWRAMNERSQQRFGQNLASFQQLAGTGSGSLPWSIPYGAMTPAAWAGLQGHRYMLRYGVTNRDLGYLSVQQRRYAANNPKAWFYNKPITLEDHQSSRWVQEPVLRLLDCCQESDGGQAILVTSLERARDLRQPPVKILGATQSLPFNNEVIANLYHDAPSNPGMAATGRRLYEKTGLKPTDIQAAMIYDAFTPDVFTQLEGFGFCGPGEAKDFIRSGQLAIDGQLPVNTHGGLLGEAYIHGMNSVAEGVRQVRGTSVNQVKNVQHVLVASGLAGAILARP